jgi:6-pyruvoyltetrahydropterin/6-carboxytetrahydropterin synthase
MKNIRITKEFRFETAHALYGYDGPCKNVHGHSYQLSVTLIGTPIADPNHVKFGMVMDFSDLKTIVNREVIDPFDHALVVNGNTPHKSLADQKQWSEKIILAEYQPSCENLLLDFVDKIKPYLPDNVQLHSAKLRETQTSYAEWFASDN